MYIYIKLCFKKMLRTYCVSIPSFIDKLSIYLSDGGNSNVSLRIIIYRFLLMHY